MDNIFHLKSCAIRNEVGGRHCLEVIDFEDIRKNGYRMVKVVDRGTQRAAPHQLVNMPHYGYTFGPYRMARSIKWSGTWVTVGNLKSEKNSVLIYI